MINVLMLPLCKAGSFGGIQSFVTTLVREAAAYPECGVEYRLPEAGWFAGMDARGTEELRDLLASGTVELIHSHNLHVDARHPIASAVQELACERGIPHVMTVHDVPWFESVRRVLLLLDRTTLVTQSQYNQERLWTMIRRRAPVVPICIDFPSFPTGTRAEPGTLAFPGRLAPHKGGLLAIQVAGIVARSLGKVRLLYSDWRRWSQGQTQEFLDALHDAAARTPGVEIEFLEDPGVSPRIYRRSLLTLALPRRPEGFGMAPLESLACGCPVVAVPSGGMKEWMTGLPGFAEPGGAEETAVAGAILDVVEHWSSYREGALAARETLEARFGAAHVLKQHRELYSRILGGHVGR